MSAQKHIDEHREEVSAEITPGVISEYLSERPDDLPETLTIKEAIGRLDEWEKNPSERMENTLITDVYADIDLDVDLDFHDVEVYVNDSEANMAEVQMYVIDGVDLFEPDSLHDELKYEICRKAMEKYSLDQLERRLGVDWL